MDSSVAAFIDTISDPTRKQSVVTLIKLITAVSGEKPAMWGSSIVAFGLYHYKYESGREGDAPKIGLSNRKQAIVVYGLHISDKDHPNATLIVKLGEYKTGKECLYIADISQIDIGVFEEMLRNVSS